MDGLDYMERGYYGAIIGDKRIVKQIWEIIKETVKEVEEEE